MKYPASMKEKKREEGRKRKREGSVTLQKPRALGRCPLSVKLLTLPGQRWDLADTPRMLASTGPPSSTFRSSDGLEPEVGTVSAKEYTQKFVSKPGEDHTRQSSEPRAAQLQEAGSSFNGPNTCRERPMEFFRKGPGVAPRSSRQPGAGAGRENPQRLE